MPTEQVLLHTHPRRAPTTGIRSLGITMSLENGKGKQQLCKRSTVSITDRQKRGPALQSYGSLS